MTVVRISDDSLAIACGADAVAEAFAAAGCSVERVSSWGMHWLEPLVEIGGTGFGPATPDDIAAILVGTSLKAIGKIADHPFIALQQRLSFARAGLTRPLSLADYARTGGWAGLKRARAIGANRLLAEVLQSGLRGRGGAGFPAGTKWQTVANAPASTKYVVCNADEGDSGTFADRMMMEGDPFQLIEGMAIAGLAVGAGQGYIYVRSEYPRAIAKLRDAISFATEHIAPFRIELRVGAGAYVCGEETSLLNSIEGKRGEVRVKPPLPALEGLFGCPTVVNNVLTLAAIPHILAEGGASLYDSLGIERSRGTMPIQLAGNIRHGGLFETAFGISLRELIYDIGGGTFSGRPVKAVQVGGPLGSYIHPSQFDLPFGYEAYSQADALIGHGGVVVFDDTADMGAMARFAFQFCAAESCGKCTPCRIGSTRGVELIDRIRARPSTASGRVGAVESFPQMHNARKVPSTRSDDLTLLEDLCETMRDASLCALGGFTPYPVRSALRNWPEDFGPDFAR
ncbi:NADH-ubiquinone oxidoreductase-F iron-sulfur binding region domain-containing protein [Novosphingobium sp.]|uniref:NADH-ubiquinone oxidoreductase-F iron-sulfur binding region domain-containing protein n=1 Tax=Novosphingobium sp. TaxID=1874826 RepID=UPI002733AA55|nr:NADH-ubiquinone oxidoreductase-F iron-sulfur binding region domain-containing protein [Novosphingobium sp.]MDP3908704.1 NADH-ubiquinone oxidoreductase-F iron-sulfur binding region domain-containing protein [Novosphingobium sp.]